MSSPKRKRDVHDPDISSAPLSPSRGRPGTSDLTSVPYRPLSGTGSPRARIVRQFEGLQIKNKDVSTIDWEKKVPHPEREVDSESTQSKQMNQAPKKAKLSKSKGVGASEQGIMVIAQPVPQVELQTEAPIADTSEDVRTLDQCPASEDPEMTSKSEEEEVPLSKKPRSRQKSSAQAEPEQENPLTWQDHEITGHLKDGPDDDGEGLNGVGFMPTPALAYARTERRRQQIQEYKNREAREARRIRSERRRGEKASESAVGLQDEARKVRFAEVGSG